MQAVKSFTQKITGIIVYPTVLLLIPFVLTKIGQLIDLWSIVDKLYPITTWLFWFMLLATRVGFTLAWYKLGELFVARGQRGGFFWFKEGKSYYSSEPDPVDKSGEILSWIALIALAATAGEVAIRIFTLTNPPYFPLPN